ncbi:MAG: hypothetical protein KAU31_08450, partial [Spirochaetaceae bacterium]|nr:hypothetical protein [Spirochaetaceae bacterium]
MTRRTGSRATLLILTLFVLAVIPAVASDRVQRTVAIAESFVPLAFLLMQGTDTPFELAVVGGSVVLHTVPNTLMLIGE